MSKLSNISDRALETALDLVHQASGGLRSAGSSVRDMIPSRRSKTQKFIRNSAAIGAVRTGSKAAGTFVKRNPVAVSAVAAVGVGLLGYAVFRRYKQKQAQAIESTSRRLEPATTRGNAGVRAARATRYTRAAPKAPTDA
ncbi:hypothetical protein [Pseudoxanthomonas sp. JBR18]|uniref:hypothetical protein n=1 Tax=Pseudoxanthomonas sp. JBR18 TaxID=2969308 RepID=UPI0023065EFA|nr:hypothetical protein [Pseudoxanthomonas sp. JBR18]WCE05726.1 hypothetical protein PJ250_07210 [Pseudoxanthomonas sp. JBR18]